MASHCCQPSGSFRTMAPETMATMGIMMGESETSCGGSHWMSENHSRLPNSMGTSVM